MLQSDVVLGTDHPHTGGSERGKLVLGRALPQPDVQIDARGLIRPGVGGILQPDSDGEKIGIGRRAIGPPRYNWAILRLTEKPPRVNLFPRNFQSPPLH